MRRLGGGSKNVLPCNGACRTLCLSEYDWHVRNAEVENEGDDHENRSHRWQWPDRIKTRHQASRARTRGDSGITQFRRRHSHGRGTGRSDALVQDAAYGTLLREPRRALHARIVEVLESQFGEIAESQPELLAHHCTEAGL